MQTVPALVAKFPSACKRAGPVNMRFFSHVNNEVRLEKMARERVELFEPPLQDSMCRDKKSISSCIFLI